MKRLFDLTLVIVFMPMWLPAIVIIYLLIALKLGSPAFFRQQRPGYQGKIFTMVKFRSMTDERDRDGRLLPDAMRLTAFGKMLRSTSLDELPELWNVLKGEMSLVGPRPLLIEYLPLYSAEQARRHNVRPGITGWAQINGRNAITWQEKFNLDTWYVDHQSLWLDVKILYLTLAKVFAREGVNEDGHATAEPFKGNRS